MFETINRIVLLKISFSGRMKSATKGMLEAIAHLLEALFSITDQKTQLLTNVIIQCRRNI
jgi:hypothetical protein